MQQKTEKIRAFLAKYIQTHDLLDDDDIFASGFVNSLFAVQLVYFVESAFEVQIENEDLKIENFRSVNALGNLIERKLLHAQNPNLSD